MQRIWLLLTLGGLPALGWSQLVHRPEVLIVGTYHMSNPGNDLANMQADDVLRADRQEQMTKLIEILKKFKPTKIAVEKSYGDEAIVDAYTHYLAGGYVLTRTEREQLGFRLAKEQGQLWYMFEARLVLI